MINSSVSYQAGVARIDDLRLAADAHRRAGLVSRQSDSARSMSSRSRREQLRRTLAALRPPRAARA
jgi:hypothetical protein